MGLVGLLDSLNLLSAVVKPKDVTSRFNSAQGIVESLGTRVVELTDTVGKGNAAARREELAKSWELHAKKNTAHNGSSMYTRAASWLQSDTPSAKRQGGHKHASLIDMVPSTFSSFG